MSIASLISSVIIGSVTLLGAIATTAAPFAEDPCTGSEPLNITVYTQLDYDESFQVTTACDLYVSADVELPDNAFPSLRMARNIDVDTPLLTEAFPQLNQVQQLDVSSIQGDSVFPALTMVDEGISIEEITGANAFGPLPSVPELAVTALLGEAAFPSLNEVGVLFISNLDSSTAFPALTAIQDQLTLEGASADGVLPSLLSIGSTVEAMHLLGSGDGVTGENPLPNLVSIMGSIQLQGNAWNQENLFPNLEYVSGDFEVHSTVSGSTETGLNRLTTVGGRLYVQAGHVAVFRTLNNASRVQLGECYRWGFEAYEPKPGDQLEPCEGGTGTEPGGEDPTTPGEGTGDPATPVEGDPATPDAGEPATPDDGGGQPATPEEGDGGVTPGDGSGSGEPESPDGGSGSDEPASPTSPGSSGEDTPGSGDTGGNVPVPPVISEGSSSGGSRPSSSSTPALSPTTETDGDGSGEPANPSRPVDDSGDQGSEVESSELEADDESNASGEPATSLGGGEASQEAITFSFADSVETRMVMIFLVLLAFFATTALWFLRKKAEKELESRARKPLHRMTIEQIAQMNALTKKEPSK